MKTKFEMTSEKFGANLYTRDGWEEIYFNYEKAMSRRRPDSVLDMDRFRNYLERGDISMYYITHGGKTSAVIGRKGVVHIEDEEIQVFMASHFAPANPRSGFELLRRMSKCRKCLIIFTITEDLVEMLQGVGFSHTGIRFPMVWNGEVEEKHVMTQLYKEPLVRVMYDELQKGGDRF